MSASETAGDGPAGRADAHLVVMAHPDPRSYTASICDVFCEALRATGREVHLRDLYRDPIDGSLTSAEYLASRQGDYPEDVAKEHALLRRCDAVTLIHPLWWMGPPAVLKGWLDRVLSYGVAYTMHGEDSVPLLGDKVASTIVTMGTALEDYEADGSLVHMQSLWNRHVFGFCGMQVVDNIWLGNAALASDDARERHRERVRALARAHAAIDSSRHG